MKPLATALTITLSLLLTPHPTAHAGELSGVINLADMGVTWQGVTFTGIDGGSPPSLHPTDADISGFSVSNAGDINGDGIDDLLIGAFQAGDLRAGETYLIYGNSQIPEPGTFALLGLGGLALARKVRRRQAG